MQRPALVRDMGRDGSERYLAQLSGKKFRGMLAKKTEPLCNDPDPDKESMMKDQTAEQRKLVLTITGEVWPPMPRTFCVWSA